MAGPNNPNIPDSISLGRGSIPLHGGWDDCDYSLVSTPVYNPHVHNTVDINTSDEQLTRLGFSQYSSYGISTPYEHDRETSTFQVAPLHFTAGPVPRSSNSSNQDDFPDQFGIEKEPPTITVTSCVVPKQQPNAPLLTNHYLQVNPVTTKEEKLARRSYRFHSEYPYTLQNWMNTMEEPHTRTRTFHIDEEPPVECHCALPAGFFIKQGMEFGHDSMLVAPKSSYRSKLSYNSSGDHSSGEGSWQVFPTLDEALFTGGWIGDDGDVFENGDGSQLHMSGMTEYNNYDE